MKVIKRRLTRGDYCTQPGGVVLRQTDRGEYVVHTFNRAPGSAEPAEFYWGFYSFDYFEAEKAYEAKVDRARRYDAGGSLIPKADEEKELKAETIAAAQRSLDEQGFAVLDDADPEVLHGVLHGLFGD